MAAAEPPLTTLLAAEVAARVTAADGAATAVTGDDVLLSALDRYERSLKFDFIMAEGFQPEALAAPAREAVRRRQADAAERGRGSATQRRQPPLSEPAAPPPSNAARLPLAGVVAVVSSDVDLAGAATTAGLPLLAAGRAAADADAVAALKAGGGVRLLGHAAQGPLNAGAGFLASGGAVKNPWSALALAGGAQAGVAAAVAARLAGVGLAVDAGGEALVPAAHCGAVALRPAPGRYQHRGLLALHPTLDALAVVARTVDDLALVDGVLVAAAGGKSAPEDAAATAAGAATLTTTDAAPATAAIKAADATPSSLLRDARIGVLRHAQVFPSPTAGGGTTVDPAVDAVVAGALQRLAKAGAVLVEVDLPPEVMSLVDAVMDPVAAYEAPRALAAYLFTHATAVAAAPPQPASADGEEGADAEEAALAAAPAADAANGAIAKPTTAPPPTSKPLDALLSVSAVVAAFRGPPDDAAAALAAQLHPCTAVPHEAYLRALTVDRPRLQAAVAAAMSAAGVTALVCPTAPVAAMPPAGDGGAAGSSLCSDSVDVHGTPTPARRLLQAATALPAAAGLPALTVPVGATKPKLGAVAGTSASERLPVGLMLLGPPGGDAAALLALGRGVQALQSLLPDPVAMRAWGSGVTQPHG